MATLWNVVKWSIIIFWLAFVSLFAIVALEAALDVLTPWKGNPNGPGLARSLGNH